MIIDTCSVSEVTTEGVKVLGTDKSSTQFLNIYTTMLQSLMNVSRKPLIMVGGLNVNPYQSWRVSTAKSLKCFLAATKLINMTHLLLKIYQKLLIM